MATAQTDAQYDPIADSVGAARRWAAKWLAGQGIPDTVIDDVALCLSEVLTNAVRHQRGSAALHVRVAVLEHSVRFSVRDGNSAHPVPRSPAYDDENGRGLVILDALSSSWGFACSAAGKSVWCEVPR